MKKTLKIIKAVTVAAISAIALAFVSFYILIVLGLSPRLQETWVCTAMTTMNHKYLATAFFSDEKIEEILEKNRVSDEGYDSTMEDFTPITVPHHFQKKGLVQLMLEKGGSLSSLSLKRTYISDGYKKLEDGIFLKEVAGTTWKGYVMLVSDPARVKLVDTIYQYEKGQTVKGMVTLSGAVAGINGGGFSDGVNYDSNGGTPAGLVIENGELVYPLSADDSKEYNLIGINKKGVLVLKHCDAKWALDNEIVSAVSFSPFIVVNGEGTIKSGTGGWGIAPRSAIGQRATGEFLFLVIDGRQIGWSIGCDLDVLQKIMLEEKAENAAMLDGGSSTVLFYDGEYVNRPSLGHERLINNCFVVTK